MKNKKLLFSLIIFFAILLFSNICFAGDLDYINDYTITVIPRNDGTLDMTYHLEWKVLDSDTEGPLEWIKIGIPNSNVDGIKALSSNIQKIRYYEDNGEYIRIDFNRAYYEGEVLDIDFKFHQSHMYTLTDSKCKYKFVPGWFKDTTVKKLTVLWDADNVLTSNSSKRNSDNYLVWNTSPSKGRTCTVEVTYEDDVFNTSSLKQAKYATQAKSSSSSASGSTVIITIAVIGGILLVIFLLSSVSGSGYNSHRGFGYSSRRSYYDDDDDYWGGSSSSSCVSSCACACACAGGGRAGCSKKDFYGTNLRTQKLNKILNS